MTATVPMHGQRAGHNPPCANCGERPRGDKMVYCRPCRTVMDRAVRAKRRAAQIARGETVNLGKPGTVAGYFRVPKMRDDDLILVLSRQTGLALYNECGAFFARFGSAVDPEVAQQLNLALKTLKAEMDGHGMSASCTEL